MFKTIIKRIRAHNNRIKAADLMDRAAQYSRVAEAKLAQAMRYADTAPNVARLYGDQSAEYSRTAGRLRLAARVFQNRADALAT